MARGIFRRLAVAVDGSANADAALDVAIDIAGQYHASLTVVGVAPFVPVYMAPSEPFVPAVVPPSELGRFRQIVEDAVKKAKGAGLGAVDGIAYEGVIVDELLDHLDKHPTDLLVVGSRGLTTAKRIFLGSVSSALVEHAPCPVLVVRPSPTKT
ncbi:MAG TPA: universal stress protein [Thermoplasmata archaeon]|nr:universal stress protein [Thermoplasmata archaeon]